MDGHSDAKEQVKNHHDNCFIHKRYVVGGFLCVRDPLKGFIVTILVIRTFTRAKTKWSLIFLAIF